MSNPAPATRVAVLGGGMAALTAAYELAKLNVPGQPPRFDITVYQQGWRLGGKGASGRGPAPARRIEEHGLHVWFGAYENAFRTMRDVYTRCRNRWPFGVLEDAFKPQFGFDLMEELGSGWAAWHFPLPPDPHSSPGDSGQQGRCTPRQVLGRLGERLANYYESRLHPTLETLAVHAQAAIPAALQLPALQGLATLAAVPPDPGGLHSLAQRLQGLAVTGDRDERTAILQGYETFRTTLGQPASTFGFSPGLEFLGSGARRTAIVCGIASAVIVGTLRSAAYDQNDWDALNDRDLRDWLRQELGIFAWMADTSLVEASYDLYFSYPRGDTSRGSIEAGTMLRAAVWLLLEYKGAFMWRMRSGMGDTIFTPLYHALDAMGVKFEFFHKVKALSSSDGARITGIRIERQASLKDTNAGAKYLPFVTDARNCDCWPSRPDFQQLQEGSTLEASWDSFNLESDWSRWNSPLPPVDLVEGTHFDKVILGIPLAPLKDICATLPRIVQMAGKVQTVQTQAFQLWLKPSLRDLQEGPVPFRDPPVLTTFRNPIDTYADMTHVGEFESWPGQQPGHVAYFCGVLEDSKNGGTPTTQPGYPAAASAQVKGHALALLQATPAGAGAAMGDLWRGAFPQGTLDWTLLCDPGPAGDPLARQYLRANIDASDRYVIAAAGTSQFRLKTDGSGYTNLFLAGDWVYNGLFVGCVEGAVISGKQAARALSGAPIDVIGEGNLFKRP